MGQVWDLLRGWADQRPGGMNDSQIARALDVQPQLVGKWKAGTVPGPVNLARIALRIGEDYETVLLPAAINDLGYLPADVVVSYAQRPGAVAKRVARRGGLTQAEREEAETAGRRRRPTRKGENSLTDDETA